MKDYVEIKGENKLKLVIENCSDKEQDVILFNSAGIHSESNSIKIEAINFNYNFFCKNILVAPFLIKGIKVKVDLIDQLKKLWYLRLLDICGIELPQRYLFTPYNFQLKSKEENEIYSTETACIINHNSCISFKVLPKQKMEVEFKIVSYVDISNFLKGSPIVNVFVKQTQNK